jgi:hypothetical protein
MIKRIFASVVMLLAGIFFLTATASPVDGKWKATVPTPEGEMELVYVFKVDGDKLTGTATSPMGEAILNNGRAGENEYSFDLDVGTYYPLLHKFRLENEEIKMTVIMDGTPYDFTLKRAEE